MGQETILQSKGSYDLPCPDIGRENRLSAEETGLMDEQITLSR
jgi:hypothetical protein